MSDLFTKSLDLHKKFRGKIAVNSIIPFKNKTDLALAYTPGVAAASKAIAQDTSLSYDLTWRGRTVAVISDGSAVLGLGNIGPEAALPVMEGKALLLKEFGGVDAVPLVVNTQDTDEIIRFVRQVAPSFAGINLEDIAAPRCFEIEDALQDIGIPVFHDDQHGTAIVVMAALQNAAKVVGKPFDSLHVVIVGAGAAGTAIAKMLLGSTQNKLEGSHVANVISTDRKGALHHNREGLNSHKQTLASFTNKSQKQGQLADIVQGADAIIGVSGPGTITPEMISTMADQPIVFALANPAPEILPDQAKAAGAAVIATGRSDLPNQINNVLAFPGVFRAVIDGRLTSITPDMKTKASQALAELITSPTPDNIIPDVFYPHLAEHISKAILT